MSGKPNFTPAQRRFVDSVPSGEWDEYCSLALNIIGECDRSAKPKPVQMMFSEGGSLLVLFDDGSLQMQIEADGEYSWVDVTAGAGWRK